MESFIPVFYKSFDRKKLFAALRVYGKGWRQAYRTVRCKKIMIRLTATQKNAAHLNADKGSNSIVVLILFFWIFIHHWIFHPGVFLRFFFRKKLLAALRVYGKGWRKAYRTVRCKKIMIRLTAIQKNAAHLNADKGSNSIVDRI